MSYTKQWSKSRKDTRKRKLKSLNLIKEDFKSHEDYKKISELIKLYIDTHDLVTNIGLEISRLVDKKNKNS